MKRFATRTAWTARVCATGLGILAGGVMAGIHAQDRAWPDTLPPSLLSLEERLHALPVAQVEGLGLAAGAGAISGIPGSLHVITARELRRFGYTDAMRALRTVSGMQLQEEDGWGLRPNIGIRGSGSERSTRITVVEDGILVAPAAYSAPAAYYFPSMARMSQVEVLKGSGQIAFGPRTAGGALSFTSTPIPDEAVRGQVRMEGATWQGRLLHAYAGGSTRTRHGTWGYLVEQLAWGSDGFKELPDGSSTGFDKRDVMVKLQWRSAQDARWNQRLGLKLLQAVETSHETYLGLTDADFEAQPRMRYAATQEDRMDADWKQAGLNHRLQGDWERGGWSLETDLYATALYRNWYKLDRLVDASGAVVGLGDLFAAPEAQAGLWNMVRGGTGVDLEALDVRANARTYFSRGVQTRFSYFWTDARGAEQRWVLGLRWHADGMDRSEWRDRYQMRDGHMQLSTAGQPGSAANSVTGAQAFSGWARLHWRRGDWVVTPGIRAEQIGFEQVGFAASDADRVGEGSRMEHAVTAWLPGVGVHRELARGMSVYGGVHRGFIPPGVEPGARPEFSTQGELGFRVSGRGWAGQTAAFVSRYSDMLGSDLSAVGGTGSGDLFNGGSAWTHGVEFEGAWDPLHGKGLAGNLPIRASYAWTFSRFTEAFDSDFEAWGDVQSGDFMPYVAPHQASMVVAWEAAQWALDVSGRYVSAMRTVAGQGTLVEGDFTPSVAVVDAGLRVQPLLGCEVRLGVQNLFDETYLVARRPYGARPGLPRMVRVGVTFSF